MSLKKIFCFETELVPLERRVGSVGWVLDFESKGSGFDPYKVDIIQVFFKTLWNYGWFNAVVAYNILVSPSGFGKVAKADWMSTLNPSDGDVKWRSREQDLEAFRSFQLTSNFGCLSLGWELVNKLSHAWGHACLVISGRFIVKSARA